MLIGYEKIVELALSEDLSLGDLTSENIFSPTEQTVATIVAKEDLTLCGVDVAITCFRKLDSSLQFDPHYHDGQQVEQGQKVLTIAGNTISIMKGERTALNFLQRLSGVASFASRFAPIAREYGVRICDTRKTTPGFRMLEKYAVRCGGLHNHRHSLADSVMIKDNHIAAAGGIGSAVKKLRQSIPHTAKIEVETSNLDQVSEALEAGADIIMLDNMTPGQVKEAKTQIAGRAISEVSGGVNLETVESFARTGVDVISVGALTHSYPAADLSLKITP